MKKYIDEARAVNLEWVEKINKDYSMYLFPCGCKAPLQMSCVRRKRKAYEMCSSCEKGKLEESYAAQAEAVGLELVGQTGNRRTRLYKFPCGHLEEKTVKQVKEDMARCNQCIRQEYTNIGRQKGVIPLYHISGGDYWLWEFVACGHKREMQPMNVKHGDISCQECIRNKHSAEAIETGLELLGKTADPRYDANYRKYRIKKCGHEQVFAVANVKDGNWRCDICLKQKLEQEALDKELLLIGPSEKHGYQLYQFKRCGHKQEISTSQVRSESYINCRICDDSSWTRPNFLYLLLICADNMAWLKLGYSGNIDVRRRQFGLPKSHFCEVVYQKQFPTRAIAADIEKDIHRVFANERLEPEVMRAFHSKSGASECYPLKLMNKLLFMLRSV